MGAMYFGHVNVGLDGGSKMYAVNARCNLQCILHFRAHMISLQNILLSLAHTVSVSQKEQIHADEV
jgi:hypothetical protein